MVSYYLSINEGSELNLFIILELPIDNKSNNVDLFQHCPSVDITGLPRYIPSRYRTLLGSLLRYTDQNSIVSNLHYATRDENGKLVLGGAVQKTHLRADFCLSREAFDLGYAGRSGRVCR